MRTQCQSNVIHSRKRIKNNSNSFLLLLVCLIIFQQLNVFSVFSSIHANAQEVLLAVETGPIYEGDEGTWILTRSTEEAETIEFTLPDNITMNFDKTNENCSDTTEFTYDEDTNLVKVSYAESNLDKEVALYVFYKVAGTYRLLVTSTNEISEELELIVYPVVEKQEVNDNQTTTEEQEVSDVQVTEGEQEVSDSEKTIAEEQQASARADGVAEVYDEATYMAAMRDTSVHVINITADFALTSYSDRNEINNDWNSSYSRDLVINGNGHTVDFRGLLIRFWVDSSHPMNLTIKNLTAYGRNYWGPWRLDGTKGYGTVRFEDVTYYGAQLTCSPNADMFFAGDIYIEQLTSYTSPLDSSTQTTQASNQANVETTNLTIEAGATYIGKTVDSGAWDLRSGGTVTIQEDAVVDLYAPGTTGEANWNTIYVQGALNIKDGAQLNIHNETLATDVRPAIQLTSGASVYVHAGAQLNIDIKGRLITRAAIYLTSGASFIVEGDAQLNMILRNQGDSNQDAIYGAGNNKFIIGKNATFDVSIDGTRARDIIQLDGNNNTFQFADAKRVNLQLDNTNANSRLIRMSGKLDVDIQKISTWTTRTWSSGKDDNATYSWTPIYGMVATYSAANVSSVTANSLQQVVTNDFTATFKSTNSSSTSLKRILFEYIPDVEVSLNDLTNDTSKSNSYTISGFANPGAAIYLSGSDYIPTGTLSGQDESNTTLYHTIADDAGNFSITLTDGHFFAAGEEIIVHAFLNGKEAEATTTVKDEVAPDKPILDNSLTPETIAFTGTAEANATIKIYKDGVVVASGTVNEEGYYEIDVPPDVTLSIGNEYYATATDDARNESEPSNSITVIDNGYLSLIVPEALSFGTENQLPYKSARIYREDTNWTVQVVDTRHTKSEWQVSAKLSSDFVAENGATLEDLLVLATGTSESDEIPLTSTAMVIAHGSVTSDETMVSINWNKNEGLLLRLHPGEAQATTYQATVEWTLGDVPGNLGE